MVRQYIVDGTKRAFSAARRLMSDASMQRRIVAGILVVAAVVLGTRQLLQVSREVAFFTVVPLLIVCFSWMLYRELKSFFSDGVNTEGRSQERGD